MKSGTCPKCGSGDIYVSKPIDVKGTNVPISGHGVLVKQGFLRHTFARFIYYACASCHYVETYIFDDETSIKNIKEEWRPIKQKLKEKEKRKRKNDER